MSECTHSLLNILNMCTHSLLNILNNYVHSLILNMCTHSLLNIFISEGVCTHSLLNIFISEGVCTHSLLNIGEGVNSLTSKLLFLRMANSILRARAPLKFLYGAAQPPHFCRPRTTLSLLSHSQSVRQSSEHTQINPRRACAGGLL